MTITMRLILTTIILTLFKRPAWAMGVEKLIEPRIQCKETGFADGLPINDDVMRMYGWATYFAALSDFWGESAICQRISLVHFGGPCIATRLDEAAKK